MTQLAMTTDFAKACSTSTEAIPVIDVSGLFRVTTSNRSPMQSMLQRSITGSFTF